MQLEVAVRVHDGVSGVVAAAVADHEVGGLGEVVDDAALALVTPLSSNDGNHGHGAAGDLWSGGIPFILAGRTRKAPPRGGACIGVVNA